MAVSAWLVHKIVEHISSMDSQERREEFTALLGRFPPEWIDEAIEIAQEYQRLRRAVSPVPRNGQSTGVYRVTL